MTTNVELGCSEEGDVAITIAIHLIKLHYSVDRTGYGKKRNDNECLTTTTITIQ